MKPPIIVALTASAIGTVNAAVVARGTSSDQLCAGKGFLENGNWYCQPVHHITYQNVGVKGEYQDVVGMNQQTGACEFKTREFSGPLAPFNEPMYIHFRGPMRLKQVAVYLPGSDQRKREEGSSTSESREKLSQEEEANDQKHTYSHHHRHRHLHRQFRHRHHPEEQVTKLAKRVCEPITWVTATISGSVVSWINDYCPDQTAAPAPATSANWSPEPAPTTTTPATPTTTIRNSLPPFMFPSATNRNAISSPSSPPSPLGSFTRIAHYHAARQISSGLTFLANRGNPHISGTWTPQFGNTLSYVNSAGTDCAPSPQTLADTLLPSEHEVLLATDQPCDASSCGYIQPGSVAYKGFPSISGTRLVLIDFSMPHAEGQNMPAIWMLNSRVPLTGQYCPCSCWSSGCGEFDVFETLAGGSNKAKSAFHGVFRGGDSNYFERPVGGTVRVAVGFDGEGGRVGVKVLGDVGEGEEMRESLEEGEWRGLMGGDEGDFEGEGMGSVFRVGT